MDADDPNEFVVIEILQATFGVSMGTAGTIPPRIGVHRRPSAVNSLLT
jgi:hypothetical protein